MNLQLSRPPTLRLYLNYTVTFCFLPFYLLALDLSNNKLKDLDEVVNVIRDLKKLRVLFLDNNPCYPSDDPDIRVKLLAKLYVYFDPLDFPIKNLGGKKLTVIEKVR